MANIFRSQTKDQTFENGLLKIHNNLISSPSGIVQVANISRVYIDKLPQQPYKLGIALLVVGLIFINLPINMALWGVVCAGIGIVLIYLAYQSNKANKYGLFIEMNSGNSLIFPSGERSFLYEVANFLANIIEGKINADRYSIVFNDNSIHDVTGAVVTDGTIERMETYVGKAEEN